MNTERIETERPVTKRWKLLRKALLEKATSKPPIDVGSSFLSLLNTSIGPLERASGNVNDFEKEQIITFDIGTESLSIVYGEIAIYQH
ncbi:hypothetical protein HDU98_004149 [Podochytrium sp. JEL0797]|nr:hypothetical protein HDU98_004149 [Podochytrium sp. JEL0797]